MSLLEVLMTMTGGVRSALVLLGIMTLMVLDATPRATELIDIYRARTGRLFA